MCFLTLLVIIYLCRVDRNKYQIQIPLPPKIDPSVTMMTVEEKPDVTYNDIGGCKEQIEKMREVSETNLLFFRNLNAWFVKFLVLFGEQHTYACCIASLMPYLPLVVIF